MSVEFRSKSRSIASRGISETGTSGRQFATGLTVGALVLALVLGAAMPAKADKADTLAQALIAALLAGGAVNQVAPAPRAPPVVVTEPVKQNRVPSVCAISIDGAQRSVSLYSENCIRREGFDQRLPRGCANDARIFGRDDRVYSAQCLRDAGIRLSGR